MWGVLNRDWVLRNTASGDWGMQSLDIASLRVVLSQVQVSQGACKSVANGLKLSGGFTSVNNIPPELVSRARVGIC